MSTLNKTQARELATLFTDFSAEIAKHRYDHWENLSLEERRQSIDQEYGLMTEANKMSALAGVLALDELDDVIEEINASIKEAEKFLKKVKRIKTGAAIIAGVFSLATAVMSKDLGAIRKEAAALNTLTGREAKESVS